MNFTQSTFEQVDTQDWVKSLLEDCDPDERLHNIVKDVARLFRAPIAMINLLTPETVVFKACVGQVAGDSLDRDGSFCNVALSQELPLNIIDASKDAQFKDYILVTNELQIRSYFGKSLHAPDGTRIGTLCVLDQNPREYSAAEHQVLAHFAEAAEAEIQAILKTIYRGDAQQLVPSIA